MNNHRLTAKVVGVLFIIASASAIAGLLLYQPVFEGSDVPAKVFAKQSQVVLGAVMELLLVLSAVGTAVGLFPFVRKQNESVALGYVLFRFLEAMLIVIGIVAVLSLLTIRRDFVAAAAPNIFAFQASMLALKAVKDWTFILGPHLFLGVNTMLYTYLLYKSKLVPRWLAAWGLSGSSLIAVVALFELFGAIPSAIVIPLAMPVATFEMVFAGWLIAKGFHPSAIAA